jgi:hypothetical protein
MSAGLLLERQKLQVLGLPKRRRGRCIGDQDGCFIIEYRSINQALLPGGHSLASQDDLGMTDLGGSDTLPGLTDIGGSDTLPGLQAQAHQVFFHQVRYHQVDHPPPVARPGQPGLVERH